MTRLTMLAVAALLAFPAAASAADSVLVQCGQQYQAAKAAGTLDGQSWTQYRTACSTRLKAQPTAATGTAPAVAQPAVAAPSAPAPAQSAPPASAAGGRAAMLIRQKQCGAEWRAQKVTLIAQTPGLTWPKYWSQCNTRLKAAGQ